MDPISLGQKKIETKPESNLKPNRYHVKIHIIYLGILIYLFSNILKIKCINIITQNPNYLTTFI